MYSFAPHQLLPGALRYGNGRRSFLFPSFELCEVYKLAAGERGEMRIKQGAQTGGDLQCFSPIGVVGEDPLAHRSLGVGKPREQSSFLSVITALNMGNG